MAFKGRHSSVGTVPCACPRTGGTLRLFGAHVPPTRADRGKPQYSELRGPRCSVATSDRKGRDREKAASLLPQSECSVATSDRKGQYRSNKNLPPQNGGASVGIGGVERGEGVFDRSCPPIDTSYLSGIDRKGRDGASPSSTQRRIDIPQARSVPKFTVLGASPVPTEGAVAS